MNTPFKEITAKLFVTADVVSSEAVGQTAADDTCAKGVCATPKMAKGK